MSTQTLEHRNACPPASTIYRRPSLSYGLRPFGSDVPVNALFIHTRTVGDYNRVTYSTKKLESTKDTTRTQVYFVEHPGPDTETPDHKHAVRNAFLRGRTYFTAGDGFLFGAYAELAKLGEIAIINC